MTGAEKACGQESRAAQDWHGRGTNAWLKDWHVVSLVAPPGGARETPGFETEREKNLYYIPQ